MNKAQIAMLLLAMVVGTMLAVKQERHPALYRKLALAERLVLVAMLILAAFGQ